jgi:hypothetical protein
MCDRYALKCWKCHREFLARTLEEYNESTCIKCLALSVEYRNRHREYHPIPPWREDDDGNYSECPIIKFNKNARVDAIINDPGSEA